MSLFKKKKMKKLHLLVPVMAAVPSVKQGKSKILPSALTKRFQVFAVLRFSDRVAKAAMLYWKLQMKQSSLWDCTLK